VPREVYLEWKEERENLFGAIRKVQAANANYDPEQVMRDVLEAQQAVRQGSSEQ
jgi:hypothetical protein